MKTYKIPRVVIAGTNSGVGKTTIVAGLLAAYTAQGKKVQPFKVGPDYIDPGFHKLASGGRDCYNLDTWLVRNEQLVPFFNEMAAGSDLAIIEGVMGLYDGGREGVSSTAQIAKALQAPVVLVIDCKAMGESAAAIAKGFRDYDPDVNFAGVLLNRLGSDNHELMIRNAIGKLGIPIIGAVRRDDRMHSPERHLGLTPVTETDPTDAIATVREAVSHMVDLEALETVATSVPDLATEDTEITEAEKVVKIGVAYDEAFSFYYPASLKTLERAGAELCYFSPLQDTELPSDVDALLFGGGFPEMFLSQLAANEDMKAAIRQAFIAGMPIYAECGGLMYLCEGIRDFEGNRYETVGLVPADCVMQQKLQKVGYVTATALVDTVIAKKGESWRGHEFHFSTMEWRNPEAAIPALSFTGGRRNETYTGGYCNGNLLASYLHMNFAGNEKAVTHFIEAAYEYKNRQL